ncbi:MAG: cadherin-like domain-containing protein, partial [Planctomycetales bacterium]|nr:cadherin-like domain-containing protein [Planctomycetales bacterium]
RFAIDGTTGVVTVNAALNYEFANTHSLTVRATSSDGSTVTRAFVVAVIDVNEAPSGVNGAATFLENTSYTFSVSDFAFSDPESNGLLAIHVQTLPGTGTLVLNGVAVNAGDMVSASAIASGLLAYQPVADTRGNNYASFSFSVHDNGGTQNGGVDIDPTPNFFIFNVLAANNAPLVTNDTYATSSFVDLIVGAPGVLINDFDANGDNLIVVLVSGPLNGTLQLGADGSLVYLSNIDFVGTDHFSYQAFDGAAFSAVATVDIVVTSAGSLPGFIPPVTSPVELTTENTSASNVNLSLESATTSLIDETERAAANDTSSATSSARKDASRGPGVGVDARPSAQSLFRVTIKNLDVGVEMLTTQATMQTADVAAARLETALVPGHMRTLPGVLPRTVGSWTMDTFELVSTEAINRELDSVFDQIEERSTSLELMAGSSIIVAGSFTAGLILWTSRA